MSKVPATHVMHDKNKDDWYSKDEGNRNASKRGATQKEVTQWARQHTVKTGGELVIHRKDDNSIRQKDSHGNDPCPPKG